MHGIKWGGGEAGMLKYLGQLNKTKKIDSPKATYYVTLHQGFIFCYMVLPDPGDASVGQESTQIRNGRGLIQTRWGENVLPSAHDRLTER